MLSGIASVIGAIGNSLKKADRAIKQKIKKNKKKIKKIDVEQDKVKADIVDAKIKAGYFARLNLAGTRLVLKLLEWFLYLLDLLIKLIILICSSTLLLLILVAVILIVFVGMLLQQIGTVGDMDSGGISIGGNGAVDVGSVDWSAIVQQAEAKAKTGEFSNLDLNRVRAFAITYELYNQSDKNWLPQAILGLTITESGFQFWNDSCTGTDYNIYTDNMHYPQVSAPLAHGVFQIEYASNGLWEQGKRDGSDFYWGNYKSAPTGHPEFVDITTGNTDGSYAVARSYAQSYFPFALKRTVSSMTSKTDDITGDEYRFGMSDIYDSVVSELGLEKNDETKNALNTSLYKMRHWRGGLVEKPNTTNAFIVFSAIYAKTGGDWGGLYQGSSTDVDFTDQSTMVNAAHDLCSGDSFVLNGTVINKNIFTWLKEEYKGNATVCNAVDGLVNLGVSSTSSGWVPARHYIGSTLFDTYIMYQVMIDYLGELGVSAEALKGGAVSMGGGNGAFGLNYYNADGTVNIEALNTLSAILGEVCSPANRFNDTFTVPAEVTIVDKDGKSKKVKTNGGTYPNFWGDKYHNDAAAGYWGQCTWYAKGRAMLWMYENVSTEESQWRLAGHDGNRSMQGDGVGQASSMANWCTVDNTIAPNSVASRAAGWPAGHVVFIEAVDTKNNTFYISHGNLLKYVHGETRLLNPDNWGSYSNSTYPFGDNGMLGRGFSYTQELVMGTSDGSREDGQGYYTYDNIAHLDKRK